MLGVERASHTATLRLISRGALLALLALFPLVLGPTVAHAQTVELVSYTLRFQEPHTHYVDIEALIPTAGQPEIELMMAVWNPGSYLIREFARNLEKVEARTSSGVPVDTGEYAQESVARRNDRR